MRNFCKLINIWEYLEEYNCYLTADLELTRIYKVNKPGNSAFMSDEEKDGFNESFNIFNESLPENIVVTVVHIKNDSKINEIENNVKKYNDSEIAHELKKAKLETFNKKYKVVEKYILLTSTSKRKKSLRFSYTPNVKQISTFFKEEEFIKNLNTLELAEKILIQNLNNIDTRRLTKNESDEYLEKIINGYSQKYNQVLPNEDVFNIFSYREQLINSDLEITNDFIKIEGKYYKSINVYKLPSSLNHDSLDYLFNQLDFNFRYHVSYYKESTSKIEKFLKNQYKQIEYSKQRNNELRADNKQDEIVSALQELALKNPASFMCSIGFIIEADSIKELNNHCDLLEIKIASFGHDLRSLRDNFHIIDNYLADIGNWSGLFRRNILFTNQLNYFMPFYDVWSGIKNGDCLYFTEDNRIFNYDLVDTGTKANFGIVSAPTGSGKSFTVLDFIKNILVSSNNIVFTIEPSFSYKKINEVFNGDYISFGSDSSAPLSPFLYKKDFFDTSYNQEGCTVDYDEDAPGDIRISIQALLNPNKDFQNMEMDILNELIIETYRKLDDSYEIPNISDFIDICKNSYKEDKEKNKIVMDFANNLTIFTKDKYGRVFNQRKAIKIENRFTSFDLSELNDDASVQTAALFMIKNLIYAAMKQKGKIKFLFLDECWTLLNDENKVATDFIKTVFKMFRKMGGSGWAITQKFVDLEDCKAGLAIVESAETHVILGQEVDRDVLTKRGYNKKTIDKITEITSQMGTSLFRVGSNKALIKHIVTPIEYWIYTTHDSDINIFEAMKQIHPNKTLFEVLVECSHFRPYGDKKYKSIEMKLLIDAIKKEMNK